jgi:hypothetical protein
MCLAPEYLAEELLRLEGFTEVEYVEMDRGGAQAMLFANRADVTAAATYDALPQLDAGKPLVLLAGIHGGCYELFAHERVVRCATCANASPSASSGRPSTITRQHDGVRWWIPARILTGLGASDGT